MGTTVLGVSAATAATLAATAASAATGVAGALAAARARSDNDNYQAQVARNNATVATQNATLATQQADAKVQGDYRATALATGAQRAALGADGGTLDTGSAANVQHRRRVRLGWGRNGDGLMAQVPFVGLQDQPTAPGTIIPDRYQQISSSPDAFGAPQAQALRVVQGGLNDAGQAADAIQQRYDATVVQNSFSKVANP